MYEPPKPLVKNRGRPPSPDTPSEIHHCQRHGWIEHHNHARSGGGRRWRCKRCVGEAVTRRKQKVKRILVEEAGGCCAVCGYDRTVVNLHFHHVIPSEKAFRLSMGTGRSLDAFREEAKKCVLVCANCHGEIEAELIPSPPPRATYENYGARRSRTV